MTARGTSGSVVGWLILFGLVLPGCGSSNEPPMPTLHPVTGQVVKGRQPVKGGSLRFAPVGSQEAIMILGEVNQEGRFELTTVKGREKGTGAPEGAYEVVYIPPGSGQEVVPVSLQKTYKVTAGQNQLTIELP